MSPALMLLPALGQEGRLLRRQAGPQQPAANQQTMSPDVALSTDLADSHRAAHHEAQGAPVGSSRNQLRRGSGWCGRWRTPPRQPASTVRRQQAATHNKPSLTPACYRVSRQVLQCCPSPRHTFQKPDGDAFLSRQHSTMPGDDDAARRAGTRHRKPTATPVFLASTALKAHTRPRPWAQLAGWYPDY
eukprot:364248-Chlamydomonas_euryale.AAC.5